MANQSTWSQAVRHAKLDAIALKFDNGYLRYYNGQQPDHPDAPAPSPAMAELRFGKPAFKPAENGTLVAHPIASDPQAKGGDTPPTWFRAFAEDGVTPLHDGPISKKEKLIPNSIVDCPSFVITESHI